MTKTHIQLIDLLISELSKGTHSGMCSAFRQLQLDGMINTQEFCIMFDILHDNIPNMEYFVQTGYFFEKYDIVIRVEHLNKLKEKYEK